MIFTVDKAHIDLIAELVPGNIINSAGAPGVYFIGVFDEAMNRRPVAAASFIASCPEKSDGIETFFLNWLFVREEDRENGTGSELLSAVCDIALKSGAGSIMAKVSEEDKELADFLEKRGFVYSKGLRITLRKTLSECENVALLTGKPDDNVRSFRDILFNERNLILSLPDCDVKEMLAAYSRGDHFNFDDELGCAYIEDNRICAALIVNDADPSTIEIAKLKVFQGFRPQMIIEMLQYFFNHAEGKYDKETKVIVKAENESSRLLLKKLFPDAAEEEILIGNHEIS